MSFGVPGSTSFLFGREMGDKFREFSCSCTLSCAQSSPTHMLAQADTAKVSVQSHMVLVAVERCPSVCGCSVCAEGSGGSPRKVLACGDMISCGHRLTFSSKLSNPLLSHIALGFARGGKKFSSRMAQLAPPQAVVVCRETILERLVGYATACNRGEMSFLQHAGDVCS